MKPKDDEKKAAIHQETLNLVYEKGIAGIKMAELARKVGISPSTLYVYHKNKEELILDLFTEILQDHTVAFRKQLAGDLPFMLKLKKVWLEMLHMSINNVKEMNFIRQVKQSPYFDKVPAKIKEDKIKMSQELLDMGKQQLLIKDLPNNILESVAESNIMQTLTMVLNKQLTLSEKDMDMMFSFLWDAIKR
ncbi:MAG: TetR/AcrR family transcriptional regulator [Sediminicola sp.]